MTAHTPYVFLCLASGVALLALAAYAWRRRGVPAATSFAGLTLAIAWRTLATGVEYGIPIEAFGARLWAAKLAYLAAPAIPILFLIFAARYSQRDRWLTRPVLAALWVVAIVQSLLVLTNDRLGLYWPSVGVLGQGAGAVLDLEYGPIANLFRVILMTMAVAAIGLLVVNALRAPRIFRRQSTLVIIAAVIPLGTSLISIFDLGPWTHLDYTPLGYILGSFLIAWAVFRYQLVTLAPIAYDALYDNLRDGVVAVSSDGHIAMANPTATLLLTAATAEIIGWPVADLAEPWCSALHPSPGGATLTRNATVVRDGASRVYEVSSSTLQTRSGQHAGQLFILHDVTNHMSLRAALAKLNLELEERVEERTVELRRTQESLAGHVSDLSNHLSALYEVILLGGQELDAAGVRSQTLEAVLAALHGDAGFILNWDAAEAGLKLTAQRGLSPAQAAQLAEAPPAWFFDDQAPHTILDLAADEVPGVLRIPGMQTLLATGSVWRGQMAGALGVYWKTTPVLNVEEIALFRALADQLAVLIENVRLRQVHDARVAEQERQRLARDLHDSVTQAVYDLALSTDTASNRLAKGQLERLDQSLSLMRTQARQALRDLRLLLYELQLATPDKMTLEESLQFRLDAVERRAGVTAELYVSPGLSLPRTWERELYWIAMEALNNALKHAQASWVGVRLEDDPHGVMLTITDNGHGLPSSTASAGGIGLHSMAARAASIGGVFSISRPSGGGACVAVRLGKPSETWAEQDSSATQSAPPAAIDQTTTTGMPTTVTPTTVTVISPERQVL